MHPPTVSTLNEARAALCAGATAMQSPAFAACHAGVNYYHALLQRLQNEFPQQPFTFILCCGDDPAIAHDALRLGFLAVRIRCSEGMFTQLQQIAQITGANLSRNA